MGTRQPWFGRKMSQAQKNMLHIGTHQIIFTSLISDMQCTGTGILQNHHFFSYINLKQYNKYTTFWLLTKNPYSLQNCSIDWSTSHQSIVCYWRPYFHLVHHNVKTFSWSLTWRTRILKTSNGYVSGKSEYNFFEKMKVYNKTVIDWLLGQQQFCLTLERICCSQPAGSGNISVLRSNKIAIVLKPSQ